MYLEKLQLVNTRNLQKEEIFFDKKLTVLIGKNGSGKTNILEAVRLLSIPKSFRAPTDFDVIHWEREFARIEGSYIDEGIVHSILYYVENKNPGAKRPRIQKTCKVDNTKVSSIELMGNILTVLFSPQEMQLITDPPRERRSYLDSVLCQVDKRYCKDLLEYKKVVTQRNKLLQAIASRQSSEEMLVFWDQSLIDLGSKIVAKRQEMFDAYNAQIQDLYQEISGSDDTILVQYEPVATKETFEEMLEKKKNEELRTGYTVVGPHRDNFFFQFNERNIIDCGSRGECRSTLLALKKCEVQFIEAQTKKKPLLLLDDVFSELDVERQARLLSFLDGVQTIITTTEIDQVDESLPKERMVYTIKDGKVTKE